MKPVFNPSNGKIELKDAQELLLKVIQGEPGPQGEVGPMGPQGPQGERGEIGPMGPQGAQGPKGDRGDKGDKGDPGIDGKDGLPGKDGRDGIDGMHGEGTVIYSVILNPEPNQGRDGDFAVAATGNLFEKKNGTWELKANLSGPRGRDGAAGPAGANASDVTTTKGDLIAHNGTANARLPIGAYGQILIPDSAQTLGLRYVNPTNLSHFARINEDWITGGVAGSSGWTVQTITAGGGVMNTSVLDATHWGIVELRSGTANGNGGALHLSASRMVLGTANVYIETMIRLSALSDGTNDYTVRLGLSDNTSGDANNGVYFEYVSGTSVNWQICQANGGSRSKTTSSTAVATGWLKLGINIGSSSSEFFVNGTSIGTQAGNFPTDNTAPFFQIIKGANGSTQRLLYVDAFDMFATWASGRT